MLRNVPKEIFIPTTIFFFGFTKETKPYLNQIPLLSFSKSNKENKSIIENHKVV
jgi:hypothetical protein